jgi:hypothetical protein
MDREREGRCQQHDRPHRLGSPETNPLDLHAAQNFEPGNAGASRVSSAAAEVIVTGTAQPPRVIAPRPTAETSGRARWRTRTRAA